MFIWKVLYLGKFKIEFNEINDFLYVNVGYFLYGYYWFCDVVWMFGIYFEYNGNV